MSRTSSERLALGLALAAALAAACARREIDVTPFAISAVALVGPPVEPPAGAEVALLTLTGTATRESDTSLVVSNAVIPYTVRLSFSNAASRDVVFPDQLDGAEVLVHLFAAPDTVAPGGTPIPFPAFRVAIGNRYQFVIGESSFESPRQVALVPPPVAHLDPALGFLREDYPFLEVFADNVYFEPAECALQYYDVLQVRRGFGQEVVSVLRSDETLEISVPEGDAEPWTVRHVLSWHARESCDDGERLWTQVATWRK